MNNAACLVCFRGGSCTLDDAAEALKSRRLTVQKYGDQLAVSFTERLVLRVAYAAGGYVAEEAAEIAQGNSYAAALLPCDARFEILIDDLDATLDEYSTLHFVQEVLEELTGGFLFNDWNGWFPGSTCNP